jgi:hypothetical protein
LVNPNKYQPWEDLWLSQAPPGERLDEFVRKEWNKEAHVGETPKSVIGEALHFSLKADSEAMRAGQRIGKNHREFERLQNDMRCIYEMSLYYAARTKAAEYALRYEYSKDIKDLEVAVELLRQSIRYFKTLSQLTEKTYRFANSLQISYRAIPFVGATNGVPVNYHWTQALPLYQKELEDFRAKVGQLKKTTAEKAAP